MDTTTEQTTAAGTMPRATLYLITRSHMREFCLSVSRERRNGRFTRVSDQFMLRMEARLKAIINDEIFRHPSLGHTLK